MKNLICSLLLVICLTPLSFAGAYVPPDVSEVLAQPAPKEVIIREIREVEKAKPAPAIGLSVGGEGQYPVLAYSKDDWTMSAGYTSRSGDQSLSLSARGDFYKNDYTKFHAGMSVYPGSSLRAGAFIGAQQYITDKVSVGLDLYAIRFGSIPAVIGDVSVVGRLYL